MLRRHLLSALPLAGLTACTVASGGGTTTVTLDVARIDTLANGVLSAIKNTVQAPAVASLIANDKPLVDRVIADTANVIGQLEADAGPSFSVSVNTTTVQGFVTSIVTDANEGFSVVQNVAAKNPGLVPNNVLNMISAGLTLLSLLQVAAQLAGVKATPAAMDEATALRIARTGA